MGRGLGPKQQEMLGWLQQQWANGIQPDRDQLMGAFVMDKPGRFEWNRDKARELQKQYEANGMQPFEARMQAEREARNHPDRPQLTPRPVAEAYRRALRTLVDRGLVKVVADAHNYYRFTDPEADNPLSVVMRQGRYDESTVLGEECGRRRAPKVSKSEERRQALLQCLPADGSWIEINDLTDAFWLSVGGEQKAIDEARERLAQCSWEPYRLRSMRAYDWLRTALNQLRKAGKAEPGTIDWRSDEIVAKNETHANGSKVVAARLCVAQ